MNPEIALISASAGSGKTYRLTEVLVESLSQGVRPEAVLATTFTKKAAQELTARVRARLLKAGRTEDALRMLDGYIGTVNAVCGSLLKDFALEAGLSPTLDVLPEGRDEATFRIAASPVMERWFTKLAQPLRALEVEEWDKTILAVAKAARLNGIAPDQLNGCAQRSWNEFRQMLPEPLPPSEGENLDAELARELRQATARIPKAGDSTKTTIQARDKLLAVLRRNREGIPQTWADWIRLSKVTAGKRSDDALEGLRELAGQVLVHPRLHADLEYLIQGTFACAAEALSFYADYKRDLGLIDFVDQEASTLELLDQPDVAKALHERLDLVLVDEFQDTSPIQLALFLKLASLTRRSVWVGDQKQAIYGFRGTDPTLMEAVVQSLGKPEVLPHSWRSQPELVRFCSEFFAKAFAPVGIPEDRVRLTPSPGSRASVSPQGHLKCFRLEAKNNGDETAALVAGISHLLHQAADSPVLDKGTGQERPLEAGDIAVLCRSNADCRNLATTLEKFGIRVAMSRTGLLSRPESVLALAAYRYLIDESDSLAVAEMARLLNPDPAEFLRQAAGKGMDAVKASLKAIARLDDARKNLIRLTPSESLSLAMECVDADRAVLRWGDEDVRLGNLDALLGFATKYEDQCRSARSACSPAGLVAYFEDLAKEEQDAQAEGQGREAVQVLTYHRAKGLEWPLVVLTGLNTEPKGNPFGVGAVTSNGPLNLTSPLAGRWIRYWPWPFGTQKKVDGFSDAVETSIVGRQMSDAERRELLRLLYVGMTRARDHLVFAARCPGNSGMTAWLDGCLDETGEPILSLPSAEGKGMILVGGDQFPMLTKVFQPMPEADRDCSQKVFCPVRPSSLPTYPPARFTPSQAKGSAEPSFKIISLGPRLEVGKVDDSAKFGSMVHAFLAVDRPELERGKRLTRAGEICAAWGVESLKPEAMLEMSGRLYRFLRERYGEVFEIIREWPIAMRCGMQRGKGFIDMIIRLENGDVLVDHKTVDGDADRLEAKACGYAGQLAIYREAWEKATGRNVVETLIHFSLVGKIATL